MTDDPRVKVVGRWIGPNRLRTVPAGEELIPQMLAELDAADPLRQPASQDRVEAAQNAGHRAFWPHPGRLGDAVTAAINEALAAADRVQAVRKESLHTDFPPWSRDVWILLHYLAQKCQGQHLAERETMSHLVEQARRAFPETKNAK